MGDLRHHGVDDLSEIIGDAPILKFHPAQDVGELALALHAAKLASDILEVVVGVTGLAQERPAELDGLTVIPGDYLADVTGEDVVVAIHFRLGAAPEHIGRHHFTGDEGVLVSSGLASIEDLRSAVEPEDEERDGELPAYITNALDEAKVQYEESQNPQMIDIVIDNHLQELLHERAADYPNTFLRTYFEQIADLTNIRSFIRIKMVGETVRLLDMVLLPHGTLDTKVYTEQFDETIESFAATLVNTPYAELVAEGIRQWAGEHSLAAYERLSDNYLVSHLKSAKYIVFGVEPLIGYLLAKENEMKLIRIIVIGKLNDLPMETIRERLRDTYA